MMGVPGTVPDTSEVLGTGGTPCISEPYSIRPGAETRRLKKILEGTQLDYV